MLGTALQAELDAEGYAVAAPPHAECDIIDHNHVRRAIHEYKPDVIINAAGAVPERADDKSFVLVNAIGPQQIGDVAAGFLDPPRVVHISTDCVFSGILPYGRYTTLDRPDPTDAYGFSKAQGESIRRHPFVTVLRTSFIGHEHGLLRWLLDQHRDRPEPIPRIEGWANALWTGSTSYAVARAVAQQLGATPPGVYHLATEAVISKYKLLGDLRDALGLRINIRLTEEPHINRALAPSLMLPPLAEAIQEFVKRYNGLSVEASRERR